MDARLEANIAGPGFKLLIDLGDHGIGNLASAARQKPVAALSAPLTSLALTANLIIQDLKILETEGADEQQFIDMNVVVVAKQPESPERTSQVQALRYIRAIGEGQADIGMGILEGSADRALLFEGVITAGMTFADMAAEERGMSRVAYLEQRRAEVL